MTNGGTIIVILEMKPKRCSHLKKDEKKKNRTLTARNPKVTTPKAATPKVTPKRAPNKKKSPPHLVDEPDDVPPENIDVKVVVDQDAAKAAQNVEAATGGEEIGKNIEAMKEMLVEGVVHTNSSETESDIDVTQLAPTTYVSRKFKLKGTPKKKKNSDDEDATYEPLIAETEKLKKCKAQPTGEMPRRRNVRKTTNAIPEQIPEIERVETVAMEVPDQIEFRMATPPTSSIQESTLVQEELHITTPEQPPKTVEEPGSTTNKITTPRQEGSS
ncbi:hypothetical protein Hanom_Chr06g00554311 [Helianthus anomalus]